MFTVIDYDRSIIGRQYKSIEKCRNTLEQYTEECYMVEYSGKKFDVRASICYIVSKLLSQDFEYNIYKYMTRQEIESITKRMKGSAKFSPKDTDDTVLAMCKTGIGENYKYEPFYNIMVLLKNNSYLRSTIAVEAITLATYAVNSVRGIFINPFSINSLVVYYWACKKHLIGKNNRQVGPKGANRVKEVEENSSLEDFINSLFNNSKYIDLIHKYLMGVINTVNNLNNVYYDLMYDFRDITKLQTKESSNLQKLASLIEISLFPTDDKGSSVSESVRSVIDKRIKNSLAMIVLSSSCILENVLSLYDYEASLPYMYRICLEGKLKISKDKYMALRTLCADASGYRSLVTSLSPYKILAKYIEIPLKEASSAKQLAELAEKRASSNEEKLSNIKRQLKELSKNIKKLESEAKSKDRTITDLQSKIGDNISISELEKLRSLVSSYEDRIDKYLDRENELTRSLNKKEKEYMACKDKISKLESEYSELTEKYNRERELNNTMSVHRVFNEIPIECFINTIKNYKITMIGGDSMHVKLKDYGLDNIRLFKAGCKEITYEDIASMDLVVIATAFVDHSSIETAIKASRTHKINVLMFNNKNADMLIYSIFSEIYK